nr:hypothetical protein [Xenococcaceae cyanobacterium MO_188.B29]
CETLQFEVIQIQSTISLYEQYLQPLQDSLNEVNKKLEEIEILIVEQSENGRIQDLIAQINQIIQELTGNLSIAVG